MTDGVPSKGGSVLDGPIARVAGLSEAGLAPLSLIWSSLRQGFGLRETAHRPWPAPNRAWFMAQTWCNLLFAHWRVPLDRLREAIPPQLSLDTFDGSVWLGVTPFLVSGLRLRGTTPAPIVSRFPELNVRTYVTVGDKPGIYFLSLDAARQSAVIAARRVYRLPYFHASMAHRAGRGEVQFESERTSRDGSAAGFQGRYRPIGRAAEARPGSLEHFLAERYCLYTLDDDQRVLRAEIHHPPWPLQPASAELTYNTMCAPYGIQLEGDPLLHFSRRQDVVLWRLEPA